MKLKFENYFLLKNSVNLKEMTWTWILIHFFPVRIQDPDPAQHKNFMDPKHMISNIKAPIIFF